MQFWKLPTKIAQRADLSGNAKVVFARLLDVDNSDMVGWPGIRKLGKACGLFNSGVVKSLAELEAAGLISITKRATNRGRLANSYTVVQLDEEDTLRPGIPNATAKSDGELAPGNHEHLAPVVPEHPVRKSRTVSARESRTSSDTQTIDTDQSRPAQASFAGAISELLSAPPAEPDRATPQHMERLPTEPDIVYHPIHQAILDAFRLRNITDYDHGRYADIAAKLDAVGATPADVPERLATFRIKWPTLIPTPDSLAKNWGKLADGPLRLAAG
jgi:hypothetical protein